MDTPLLVVIADTHAGNNAALAPSIFQTRDNRTIQASPPQMWLYNRWTEMLADIKARLLGHRRLIVAHLGDAADGNHRHPSVQSLPDILDQEHMAVELLRPIVRMADRFIFTYGTDAHEGDAGSSGARICEALGIPPEDYDWEVRLWIGNYLHDFCHHGRTSARDWSSMAVGVAAEVMLTAAQREEPIPRFVWRGHKHKLDDSGEHFERCRAIVVPGWELRNAYVYKVSPNRIPPIGYAVCDGEQVSIVRFTPPRKEAIRYAEQADAAEPRRPDGE
jgi:hypothetical protein